MRKRKPRSLAKKIWIGIGACVLAFVLLVTIAFASWSQSQGCTESMGADYGGFWRGDSFEGNSAAARSVGRYCQNANFLPRWVIGSEGEVPSGSESYGDGDFERMDVRICPSSSAAGAPRQLAVMGHVTCRTARSVATMHLARQRSTISHKVGGDTWRCNGIGASRLAVSCHSRTALVGAVFD